MQGNLIWGVQAPCWSLQALKNVQSGTRILYVICAEGKANKNITIANLVGARPLCAPCLLIAALLQLVVCAAMHMS